MGVSSALLGVCYTILWTSQSSYLTALGKHYAIVTSQNQPETMSLIFGIFWMITQCLVIFGSVISTTVLQQSPPENYKLPSDDEQRLCGFNDCPGNNVTNVVQPVINSRKVDIDIGMAFL